MRRVEEFANPDESMGEVVFRYLKEHVFTEESTDVGIEFLSKIVGDIKVLNWVPGFIKRRILKTTLDKMLPEKILDLIWFLMLKAGAVSESGSYIPRNITMRAQFPDPIEPRKT